MSSNSNSNPSGNAPNSSNPFLDSYRAWAERTPFITRTSCVLVVIVYIVSWIVNLDYYLANIPILSINHFQLWRLILSPFAGNSLLFLIILFMSYPTIGTKMESTMGSGSFLFLLLTIDFLINVVFVAACYLMFFMGASDALTWICADFWLILFALLSIDCFLVPEAPRRLLCIPYDIPAKYLPLALFGLMVLLSAGQFFLAYALSIVFGYLFAHGYLDRFRPTSYFIERLETEGGICFRISRSSGWVLAGVSLGHDAWIPVNASSQIVRDTHEQAPPSGGNPPSGFTMFGRGSSGYQPVPTASMDDSLHKEQHFPGSGHKLTNASAQNDTSTGFFASSVTSSAPMPSREEIAARRLAALKTSNSQAANSDNSASV